MAPPKASGPPLRIGVLALQGGYSEHLNMLQRIGREEAAPGTGRRQFECFLVKTAEQLHPSRLDALVLPGGESTTMALVAERSGCLEPLREFVQTRPCWGTCAGLILLSKGTHHAKQGGQALLGALDVVVDRNAFGSQAQSFVAPLSIDGVTTSPGGSATANSGAATAEGGPPFPGVFIRAPVVDQVGERVAVLASVDGDHGHVHGSRVVAVRQDDRILGTAFHPELTQDTRFHKYFLDLVRAFYAAGRAPDHAAVATSAAGGSSFSSDAAANML